MLTLPDQNAWEPVLTGEGFITTNMPCFFTFTDTPTAVDIHYTTATQINGVSGKTLYIKNPEPKVHSLSYAVEAFVTP